MSEAILGNSDEGAKPAGKAHATKPATPPVRLAGGRGQKSMIWLPGVALFVIAIVNDRQGGDRGALWPVFVAIFVFLYLWWLSSLLFDLLFVWHRYIQGDAAHKFLRSQVRRPDLSSRADPPPDQPEGGITAKIPPTKPGGSGFSGSFILDDEPARSTHERNVEA